MTKSDSQSGQTRRSRGRRRSRARKPTSNAPPPPPPLEIPFKRVMLPEAGEAAVRVGISCRHLDIESVAVVVPGRDCRFAADCDVRLELPESDDPKEDAATLLKAAIDQGVDVILPGYQHLHCLDALSEALAESEVTLAACQLRSEGSAMDRGRLLQRLEEIGVDAVASQPVPHDRLVEIFDEHGGPLIARTDIVGARLPIRLNHRADAERAAMVLAGPTGQLWVEEPVPQRRSLAVTVIGDAHGDAAAMIECDTSALNLGICESPSPALLGAPDGEAIRGAFFDVATRIWRDLAVVGVGTIHFGLNIGGHFYVEDIGLGITPAQQLSEWVSGVDLVEWQLRVHAGQPISEDLHTPPESGHAFVAHVRRAPVSASEEEGAAVNFEEIGWPPTPAGTIRVFSPYETGMEVPGEDEALLARVTTFGAVRHQALLTLDRILAGCRFPPVQTNISELRRITNNESLRFGQYDVDTTF